MVVLVGVEIIIFQMTRDMPLNHSPFATWNEFLPELR